MWAVTAVCGLLVGAWRCRDWEAGGLELWKTGTQRIDALGRVAQGGGSRKEAWGGVGCRGWRCRVRL